MPARILLVEDNAPSLHLMAYLLRKAGYEPVCTKDGQEGLDSARAEHPDIVLMDLQMPRLDGFEAAARFRRDPALQAVRLVAITALAMVGDREKVLSAGFDGYIAKPITPESFVTQVEAFLSPASRTERRDSPVRSSSPVPRAHPSPARGRILVVDNVTQNVAFARSVLEAFGFEVVAARGRDDALAKASADAPDLILSDVHMPDGSGFDLLIAAKADPALRSIPFLFISSSTRRDADRQTGLNLGAAGFIERPVEPQDLVSAIEASLEER